MSNQIRLSLSKNQVDFILGTLDNRGFTAEGISRDIVSQVEDQAGWEKE